MSQKPKQNNKAKTAAQANDKSHKPAKHIEETARLASSDEANKNPETVHKAKD
jgi:hypothetical protein